MPFPLVAIAIGAGIGAVAGVAVYGAKVLWDGGTWSWRDAAAAAAGGAVGGAAFPLVLAGLAAVGLPAAASFALAGGVAWGGLWTLAQDAASWALGRREGLGTPGRYLEATALGIVLSAALLPLASRMVAPSGSLLPHEGAVSSYLVPARPLGANTIKAEAEFLAYGAGNVAASRALHPDTSPDAAGDGGVAPAPSRPAASPARAPRPSRGLVGALPGR